jgi:catechol 2,3-dioxygenase-like lactoylglutathione lyase family enzyme
MTRTRFEGAEAILRVEDISRSVRYYVDVLGFTNAEWGSGDFTRVSRDDARYVPENPKLGGAWIMNAATTTAHIMIP